MSTAKASLQQLLDIPKGKRSYVYSLHVNIDILRECLEEFERLEEDIKTLTIEKNAAHGALLMKKAVDESLIEQSYEIKKLKEESAAKSVEIVRLVGIETANNYKIVKKDSEIRILNDTVTCLTKKIESTHHIASNTVYGAPYNETSIPLTKTVLGQIGKEGLTGHLALGVDEKGNTRPIEVDENGIVKTDGLKEEDVIRICREQIEKTRIQINDFCGVWGDSKDHRLKCDGD